MAIQRDKIVASAEKLVAKGKIEPAIKEYERLLDDNPNDVNTLNRIGDLWVRINRLDEACKVYARIADHYAKDGFFLKAIAIFKKINKLDPSRLDVYAKLADLYAKQGLAMEAKGQYQVLADYYLKHGDPENALKTFQRIADLDPNSINVHVKLADLYSQNGKTAEALKEYDRVGRMLLKRGMTEEATQVFRKALKIDPGNVELAESLANTLLEARDFATAQQILESATEANPDATKLIALLGKVYIAKGDVRAAESTLSQGLAQHPGEQAIADLLSELFLRMGNADSALAIIEPFVTAAVTKSDRSAVEMLQRIARVDAGHIPTLERLVQVYTGLNEETNILSSMNSLAEAHISRGDHAAATKVLETLIKREPENAQHREKLAFVRSRGGAAATPAPPPPRAAAPPPVPFVPEPEPEMALEFDGESLDLDAASPMAPPPIIEDELPIVSVDEGQEDIDFITEQLTEAEVFAKYGLTEKAVEHLQAVLERSPKNLTAFDKLLRIHLDEGNAAEVRAIGARYVSLLEETGEVEAADALRSEIVSRGFSMTASPPSPAAMPVEDEADVLDLTMEPEVELGGFDAPEPEVELDLEPPQMAVEPEVEFDLEPPQKTVEPEVEFDLEPPQKTVEPEIEFDLEPPQKTVEPEIEFDLDLTEEPLAEAAPEPIDELSADELVLAPEEELPLEALAAEAPAPEIGFEEEIDVPSLEISEAEPAPAAEDTPLPEPLESEMAAPFLVPEEEEPEVPAGPALEELGEIDFYVEQELWEEAEERLALLERRFPAHQELTTRRFQLEQARGAAAPAAPESDLLAGIREELEAVTTPPADETNLFDEEDDFFDLAAELEQELAQEEEPITISEEEQSLEEIFKEFKRGVEQQLDAEDYDTHYNLGIAYKEMGLIDEAIGEFQLAAKDPKRMIECCSMLGLCFLEKGMPQLAIKWYQKGLEAPEISEEEHLGLLYDLGSAFLEVGDTQGAQKAFMEIYGINSNYRDIVSRIKQVEDVAP